MEINNIILAHIVWEAFSNIHKLLLIAFPKIKVFSDFQMPLDEKMHQILVMLVVFITYPGVIF